MSAGLFSSASYNRLGISLLLLRPEGPEGKDSFGSKKGEKLARITEPTLEYSDEQGGVDVATEKVDLTTLSENVKSLLRLYKNPEVEYGQVVFFQKTMEAFERVVVESEQKKQKYKHRKILKKPKI